MEIRGWRGLPSRLIHDLKTGRVRRLLALAPAVFTMPSWYSRRRPTAFPGPPRKIESRELTQHQLLSPGPFEVSRAAEAVGLTAPGDPG
jgi:hypothetical protein